MSAPQLWIIFPAVLAGILALIQSFRREVGITGTLAAALLAWLAWAIPIAEKISIGPLSITITDTLWILGRRLVLTNSERPLLVLIYLTTAFWFGAAQAAGTSPIFIPIGLGIISLLTASLGVDPVLYAALFIEMAVLLCVPLLVSPSRTGVRGVLRFLTFQTLGVLFILSTAWITASIQTGAGQETQVLQASILAGFGFAFLLAVFPFHTWLPMLSEEAHPYLMAFVFFMLPGIIFLFMMKFFGSNEWFSGFGWELALLKAGAGVMLVVGGVWAAFQRNLGRFLAYAIMVEIGNSLLAVELQRNAGTLSQTIPSGNTLLFNLFFARALALGIWALALSVFYKQAPTLSFWNVRGLGRKYPIAACALILANFSLAGFPLLAGFPIHLAMIEYLSVIDPLSALWILIGMVGLLVGALRTLAVLVMGAGEEPWNISESRSLQFFLLAGIAAMILAGVFPLL